MTRVISKPLGRPVSTGRGDAVKVTVRLSEEEARAYRLAAESVVLSGLRGELDGTLAGISELKLGVTGERFALAPATTAVDASGLTVDFGGKLAAMTLQAKLTLPQLAWQESAPASGTSPSSVPRSVAFGANPSLVKYPSMSRAEYFFEGSKDLNPTGSGSGPRDLSSDP